MNPWVGFLIVNMLVMMITGGPKTEPVKTPVSTIVEETQIDSAQYMNELKNLRGEFKDILKENGYLSIGMYKVAAPDQSGKWQDLEYQGARSTYVTQAVFQKQLHLLAGSGVCRVFDSEFMGVLKDLAATRIRNELANIEPGEYLWKTVVTDIEIFSKKGTALRFAGSTLSSEVQKIRITAYMQICDSRGIFLDGLNMSVQVARTKNDLTLFSFWKSNTAAGIEIGGSFSQGLDEALDSLLARMTYELLRQGLQKELLKPTFWK